MQDKTDGPISPGCVAVNGGYTRTLALESVGKGWAQLIHRVFDKLEAMDYLSINVIQVKEKWGGLRIYTNYYHEEFDEFIHQVEIDSFTICEDCGNRGCLRKGSWYRTLCEEHANGAPSVRPF